MSRHLVHESLAVAAEEAPDQVALVCEDRRVSYAELDTAASALACYLEDVGVRRSDRVVVFLQNSVEAVVAILGILKAGAAFVALNPGLKAAKLQRVISHSGAVALVTHRNLQRVVRPALAGLPELRHTVWCGGSNEATHLTGEIEGVTLDASEDWSAAVSSFTGQKPSAAPTESDLATIIYTSGSTGNPKGVVSTHRNVASAAGSIATYLGCRSDDIILSALPLSFDYGLYQLFLTLISRGTLVLEPSFVYPYAVLERMAEEHVTAFPIVPTMLALLLQMKDLGKLSFPSLRYVTNTGAALPPAHIARLRKLWPHVRIFSMYGLTECKRVSYLPPEDIDRKPDSVGIPMPNCDVFIVGEDGTRLPAGETGELVVRGPNVMRGYWRDPEETARVYRPSASGDETLLYSGDLFRQDDEGYLYFVARKDDLIKSRGERLSPREIELAICELEGVAEAAVIGVPDELLGQAVKAFVVPAKDRVLTSRDVQKHCMRCLEPLAVPQDVEIRNALPRSPTGKVDKAKLKG